MPISNVLVSPKPFGLIFGFLFKMLANSVSLIKL